MQVSIHQYPETSTGATPKLQAEPAATLCRGVSRVRFFRLEPEAKEESKILDLERQIGEARDKGLPVEALIEERRQTYESWIGRLDREIGNARTESDRERLRRQRERAKRDYS